MSKERKALDDFIKDYLFLCEKLCTNKQEKMLLDSNSPYNVLKTYLEEIDNATPSEALEKLERIKKQLFEYFESTGVSINFINDYDELIFESIKQTLIKTQEQEKFFDDKLVFKDGCIMSGFDYKGKQIVAMPLEEYDEFIKQKKAQKHYLKWEDLEKDKTYKVLLNGNQYELVKRYDDYEYRCDYITLQKKPNVSIYIYEYEKEIFNDLHSEVVEE